MKNRLSALEYHKERERAREYWKWRLHDEIPLSGYELKIALENTCGKCHAIRSAYEIQKSACDNCD